MHCFLLASTLSLKQQICSPTDTQGVVLRFFSWTHHVSLHLGQTGPFAQNSNEWGNETRRTCLSQVWSRHTRMWADQTWRMNPTSYCFDDLQCLSVYAFLLAREGKMLHIVSIAARCTVLTRWSTLESGEDNCSSLSGNDNCWKPSVSHPVTWNEFGSCEVKNYYRSDKVWHDWLWFVLPSTRQMCNPQAAKCLRNMKKPKHPVET